MTEHTWQEWRQFPDPTKGEYLVAPFGAGVYWLRLTSGEDIYIGEGGHVAERMTTLLPKMQGGRGTRNNDGLRAFCLANLGRLEYRTAACTTTGEAKALEKHLHEQHPCRFS